MNINPYFNKLTTVCIVEFFKKYASIVVSEMFN